MNLFFSGREYETFVKLTCSSTSRNPCFILALDKSSLCQDLLMFELNSGAFTDIESVWKVKLTD